MLYNTTFLFIIINTQTKWNENVVLFHFLINQHFFIQYLCMYVRIYEWCVCRWLLVWYIKYPADFMTLGHVPSIPLSSLTWGFMVTSNDIFLLSSLLSAPHSYNQLFLRMDLQVWSFPFHTYIDVFCKLEVIIMMIWYDGILMLWMKMT